MSRLNREPDLAVYCPGCTQTSNNRILKLPSISKEALMSTFMVANAFVWYLAGFSYLQDITPDDVVLIMVAVNLASLILAGLIVSSIPSKFKKSVSCIKYWIISGVFISFLFPILGFQGANSTSLVILGAILGAYFGVGMPVCMNFYAKNTEPQNRAKLSGLIILLIGIGVPIILFTGDITVAYAGLPIAGALAIWRIIGLAAFRPSKPIDVKVEVQEKVTYRSIVSNRTFLFYVAPWFMFALINDLTMHTNVNYFNNSPIFSNLNFLLVENVIAGASAIICGFLADTKGRKRLALIGFALLGVGYAWLGLFNGGVNNNLADVFYVISDGIAWGAFSMLFLMTIWGDIAQERNSEKYYFLGVLPYLFSNLAGIIAGVPIADSMAGKESMVFSFASFFLFVAILPLVYAPETLSDRIIKNLDINSYVNKALEKAKKDKTKAESKKTKSKKRQEKKSDQETDENSAEFEEAKKLAEKYY